MANVLKDCRQCKDYIATDTGLGYCGSSKPSAGYLNPVRLVLYQREGSIFRAWRLGKCGSSGRFFR